MFPVLSTYIPTVRVFPQTGQEGRFGLSVSIQLSMVGGVEAITKQKQQKNHALLAV